MDAAAICIPGRRRYHRRPRDLSPPEREIAGRDTDSATHRWATLAGPTCDSSDVIAREALLPDLVVGDLLVSPVMGAYTVVTSTRFNGRAATPVAVVGQGARTGALATVAAETEAMDALV